MRKEYETLLLRLALIGVCITMLIGGCYTTKGAGDESLVQARISAAVNAERNRWTAELSKQLTDGLTEIDRRVNSVNGNLEQVRTAATEYRRFVLEVIDRLHSTESTTEAAR